VEKPAHKEWRIMDAHHPVMLWHTTTSAHTRRGWTRNFLESSKLPWAWVVVLITISFQPTCSNFSFDNPLSENLTYSKAKKEKQKKKRKKPNKKNYGNKEEPRQVHKTEKVQNRKDGRWHRRRSTQFKTYGKPSPMYIVDGITM
jgi:hypothetical protein